MYNISLLNPVPAVIWTAPSVRGDRPPPMSYFTMTSVDSKRAVLFGGNSRNGRMNDTYIVTLEDSMVVSLIWTDTLY